MGGAPRNPAPRNHFLVRIVKPSGCQCTDASGGTKNTVECRPLLGALPVSLTYRLLQGTRLLLIACREEAEAICSLQLTCAHRLEGAPLAKRLAASRNYMTDEIGAPDPN